MPFLIRDSSGFVIDYVMEHPITANIENRYEEVPIWDSNIDHIRPLKEIELYKKQLIASINDKRDEYADQGVVVDGVLFDSDEQSQINIIGGLSHAQIIESQGTAFSGYWISKNNTVIPVDFGKLTAIGISISNHKAAAFIKARAIKNDILNSKTIAQAQAIFDDGISEFKLNAEIS